MYIYRLSRMKYTVINFHLIHWWIQYCSGSSCKSYRKNLFFTFLLQLWIYLNHLFSYFTWNLIPNKWSKINYSRNKQSFTRGTWIGFIAGCFQTKILIFPNFFLVFSTVSSDWLQTKGIISFVKLQISNKKA